MLATTRIIPLQAYPHARLAINWAHIPHGRAMDRVDNDPLTHLHRLRVWHVHPLLSFVTIRSAQFISRRVSHPSCSSANFLLESLTCYTRQKLSVIIFKGGREGSATS